jgi:hypothetical protein
VTADPPPVSRLEQIRADAKKINRPDAAAVVHADTPPAQPTEPVVGVAPEAPALPIVVADLPEVHIQTSHIPAVAQASVTPKRRGRPPKAPTAIIGPDGTGSATGTADLVPNDAEMSAGAAPDPAAEAVPRATDGYVLYVDCRPLRAAVTFAHDLIATASATVRNDAGVPDVGLIDYGKGYPALAAQLRSDLLDAPVAGAIVTTRYTPEGKATLQVLIEGAQEIVMGN